MTFTRRGSYPDEFINNKTLVIFDKDKLLINDNNKENNNINIPRENEFLRNFCMWRKSQGLFVPSTWEK